MVEKVKNVALYCDEAGKDTDRYLAVGGLVVPSPQSSRMIAGYFEKLKKKHNLVGEVKWNKAKKGNYEKYRDVVDLVFAMAGDGHLQFHCILVDFQRFDHDLRDDGGKGESLKRMYYQLIEHRLCKTHTDGQLLYALVDKANELDGLDELKAGLNNVCKNKYGHNGEQLRAIEFRDSASEPLLQLNDIVLGAVCYQRNRRNEEAGVGQFKSNLAGYVLGRFGYLNFDGNTPKGHPMSVWNFDSKHLRGG